MARVKSIRVQRLEETIKEELSQLLHKEIKDPRIGFVTITDVDLSPDLRKAVIFITIMGDGEEKEKTMAGLKSALGFLRGELDQRLKLKCSPALEFNLDCSIDKGLRIASLLKEIDQQ